MAELRLKYLPTFLRVTDLLDLMFQDTKYEAHATLKDSLVFLNKFEDAHTILHQPWKIGASSHLELINYCQ